MATIETIGFRLSEKYERLFNSKKFWKKTGDEVLRVMKGKTRTGEDAGGGGFPSISPQWAKYKAQLSNYNSTHGTYGRNRSNLTFTGQLVDSLTCKANKNSFTIYAKGDHSPYIGVRGKRIGKTVKNVDILEAQSSMGRVVMDWGKDYTDILKTEIRNEIRRNLGRLR